MRVTLPILGGLSQRLMVQYFSSEHAWQIETIPGIKDMDCQIQ